MYVLNDFLQRAAYRKPIRRISASSQTCLVIRNYGHRNTTCRYLVLGSGALAQSSRTDLSVLRHAAADSTQKTGRVLKWSGIGAGTGAVIGWVVTRNLSL